MTITRQEFEDRLATTKPGEKILYHTGSIMRDRVCGFNFGTVNNVAHAAFVAFEAGKVHLTQRRVPNDQCTYDYIAVKRSPPFKTVKWTGCYDPDRNCIRKAKPAPVPQAA